MATLNTFNLTTFQNIGKPIIIASHPRSGTHLTIDLLRKQFAECRSWKKRGESLDRFYFALESFASINNLPLSENIALDILSRAERPIVKTHCNPQFSYLLEHKKHWVDWLEKEADIYYIFRDGRSVLCSLHLFMQSYDPKTRCSFSEFIRQEIKGYSRVKFWANHIESWSKKQNATLLCFEDILKNPISVINKISQNSNLFFLDRQPLLPRKFSGIWDSRWARISKKNSESTAIIGYYKNQPVPKWQEIFSLEDRLFFHQEVEDLLIKLGYETSDLWINQ